MHSVSLDVSQLFFTPDVGTWLHVKLCQTDDFSNDCLLLHWHTKEETVFNLFLPLKWINPHDGKKKKFEI